MATESRRSGWRQRWADKQNERRQRAFDAAHSAWQRDDEQARWMLATAREFRGLPLGQLPPYVDLGRRETVF
ncbi:MAG: hypothetical protein IRZ05_11300 [Micromonosporaceae bacterium]|nr:hypothetical protein [Micromonosporaceae bacterium]